MIWLLWIVLTVLAVLAALCLFAIWPGKSTAAQRAPFQNRNFAHRGLYAQNQTVPENSLPAFDAACAAGYGIELDVQFTSDKKLIVFHDDTLDRMTGVHGHVCDFAYAQVGGMSLGGTDRHPPLFTEVLGVVAGRAPLIVEIKSRRVFDGAYLDELCRATLDALRAYRGAYCIESFDPRVVGRIRRMAPDVLRGQLADCARSYHDEGANWVYSFTMSHCLGNLLGRPQFLAWCPSGRNRFVRWIYGLGAMRVYWTALPADDQLALQQNNDAVIFQWYRPAVSWQNGQNG